MDGNGQSRSEWHAIRPWAPRLALFVREITSVSATFILSSSLSDPPSSSNGHSDPSLASLGLIADDDEAHSHSDGENSDSDQDGPRRELIISNALAKGLSVKVNGSPWQRVLIRIDDKADEAIVIIYGLMPGRQYDIDLALVRGGQAGVNMRRQVITESMFSYFFICFLIFVECIAESDRPSTDTLTEGDRDKTTFDSSSSQDPMSTQTSSQTSHLPLPTPPQSPSPSSSHTPSSHLSVEDRAAQLQHTLSLLHADRASLTASLKSARRDAQKSDTGLRSQIDTLKRASEKHTVAENRARQKVLALQEAVKRAQAATAEMEELAQEVEKALPDLQVERNEREGAYAGVLAEAERVRAEMEREAEIGRKKVERGEGELAGLANRLERIQGKREKLEGEGGAIPELEEELRGVQMEIERIERDPFGYCAFGDGGEDGTDPGVGMVVDDEGWDQRFSYLSAQLSRRHSQNQSQIQNQILAPIGRPSLPPIQRPSSSHVNATITNVGSTAGPGSSSLRPHRHSLEPPFVYQPPSQPQSQPNFQPQSQLQSQGTNVRSPQQGQSSPLSSSPTPSSSTMMTLSSKAPSFEPNRSVARASFPPSTAGTGFASGVGVGGLLRTSPASRRSFTKWGSMDGHSK